MSIPPHYLRIVCLLLSATACLWSQAATDARPRRWLKQHPRLLFTAAEQRQLQQAIPAQPQAARLADYICQEADRFTTLPHREYQLDGGTLLLTSGHYCRRLGVLSLAWRLTGKRTYLEAVESCLRQVCAYPDWHPGHYLDTGVMATGVALAYDWLYDALSEEIRRMVRQSLYDKAITLALKEYQVGDSQSWAKRETNWNVVCNAGMVMAALAVAEEYPQEAATVLDEAARYLPNCLNHFSPDGVCYEGPNYWIFTNTYLSIYLKAVADNDLSTAFSISWRGGDIRPHGASGFALDLGESQALDSLVICTTDEYTLQPLKVDEGCYAYVSTDLVNWRVVTFLTAPRMTIDLRKAGPVRYLRFAPCPIRLTEVMGYRQGERVDRTRWRASNLFQPYGDAFTRTARSWSHSFRLDTIPEGSYLCIAVQGRHGVEGAWAACKVDGEYVGCPDRAPSFMANTWERRVQTSDHDYTYYLQLKPDMAGRTIETFVLAFDKEQAALQPEVWVTCYPIPFRAIP